MAPFSVNKQPAGYKSPHDWLVRLAMDLATLCDTVCGGKNDNSRCHLAVFSFAHHFMATHPPPPSYHVGVLVVLTTPVKTI